jgi:hypothetical protein
MMSCHNPTVAHEDGFDGHAIWADIPQIISRNSNKKVRFALLVGDQVYADDWQDRILAAKTDDERLALYLDVYRRFWSHIHSATPSYRWVTLSSGSGDAQALLHGYTHAASHPSEARLDPS